MSFEGEGEFTRQNSRQVESGDLGKKKKNRVEKTRGIKDTCIILRTESSSE